MFCQNCGTKNEAKAEFCANCGRPMSGQTQVTNVTVNAQNEDNGMAIAGFVISLVSLLLCCGSFNWLGLIFSIVGLVQSKSKNGRGKGLAIAGIIISCFALLLYILLFATGMLAGIIEEASYNF